MKKPPPQSVVYRKLSDDELAQRYARRRDKQAALQLHARYGHLIFGLCLAVLHDASAAEDAARLIFFRVLQEGGRFRTEPFRPWLYRTIRESVTGGAPLPADVLFDASVKEAGYTAEEARFRAALMAAFETLPTEAQVALDGFYLHGHTHAELADVTGLMPDAVQQRIIDARRALKEALKTTKPGAPQALEDVVHLLHLLEEGRCLSKKQLFSYVSGLTAAEEDHAVEHHLHACPICRQVVTTVRAGGADACEALVRHSDVFLTEHHRRTAPQLHASSVLALPRKRAAGASLWRMAAIAAGVVVGIGLLLHFENRVRPAVLAEPAPAPAQPVTATEGTSKTPAPKASTAAAEPLVQSAMAHSAAPASKPGKSSGKPARLPLLTEEGRSVPGTESESQASLPAETPAAGAAAPQKPRDPFEEGASETR